MEALFGFVILFGIIWVCAKSAMFIVRRLYDAADDLEESEKRRSKARKERRGIDLR
jgi:hypothetical protein